jgi:hypothetical protein
MEFERTLLTMKITKRGIKTREYIESENEKVRVLTELQRQFYKIKNKKF